MTLQKSNADQANDGNLAGALKHALNNWLMGVDDMLPARVVSYDDTSNRAVIQPVVMIGGTDGSKLSRARIANIPVFRFGGGGFFIRFPLKAGDLGWLKANDRDISLIMQSGGGEEWPHTKRRHSFSDAMFFPDTFKQWVIDGANADALVVQSLDGAVCLALHADKFVLKSPAGEIAVDGSLSINAGDLAISAGSVAITSGSLTHNGKNVGDTHTHLGPVSAPPGPVVPTGVPL
ncbi:hypothetical protein NRB16_24435 [Pseudomonas sp. LJDD11]|uniref:Gp138 family membrane-puncturing spike protein n=1 Tax=unclassified Pseudomonas TaxID=196821 RepID=UPI0020969A7E|nr:MULTISPECIES: Gp138 family membrane-puncturing spike protein [unclassified Pseudomonas]MCO8160984.1 hypothetical protein [Pseudomonas sp. 21LCFQ010]MCQ9426672.1 hypothetical protein [Pseudomonas sp. LJDD11]